MLQPNKDLENIFERAVSTAAKYQHEYITLEHFLYSLVQDTKFCELLDTYGANTSELKTNLEDFIKNNLSDIVAPDYTDKPKKTNSIDRMLNRAFTQVLFSGRQIISPIDCFISMFGEKKSHANYFMRKANIDKDNFINFVKKEVAQDDEEDESKGINPQLEKFISQFCLNLSARAKSKKIDPVIGREKELEEIQLVLARRTKSNAILKEAIADNKPEELKKVLVRLQIFESNNVYRTLELQVGSKMHQLLRLLQQPSPCSAQSSSEGAVSVVGTQRLRPGLMVA